jgi:hypothetical protein
VDLRLQPQISFSDALGVLGALGGETALSRGDPIFSAWPQAQRAIRTQVVDQRDGRLM